MFLIKLSLSLSLSLTPSHTQRKINQGCHATPRKDIYAESTRRLKILASGARPAVVPNSFGPSTCSRRNIRSTALPSSESRSWLDKWRQCARSRVSTTAEASHLLARSHGRRRRSASAATERCQPSRESEYGATATTRLRSIYPSLLFTVSTCTRDSCVSIYTHGQCSGLALLCSLV